MPLLCQIAWAVDDANCKRFCVLEAAAFCCPISRLTQGDGPVEVFQKLAAYYATLKSIAQIGQALTDLAQIWGGVIW